MYKYTCICAYASTNDWISINTSLHKQCDLCPSIYACKYFLVIHACMYMYTMPVYVQSTVATITTIIVVITVYFSFQDIHLCLLHAHIYIVCGYICISTCCLFILYLFSYLSFCGWIAS